MFHQQKLQSVLGISWEEHVTSNLVLTLAGLQSVEALVAKNQLRFLCHLRRRKDASLPKQTVYDQLAHGSRPLGGPKRGLKEQKKKKNYAFILFPESLSVWQTTDQCATGKKTCSPSVTLLNFTNKQNIVINICGTFQFLHYPPS